MLFETEEIGQKLISMYFRRSNDTFFEINSSHKNYWLINSYLTVKNLFKNLYNYKLSWVSFKFNKQSLIILIRIFFTNPLVHFFSINFCKNYTLYKICSFNKSLNKSLKKLFEIIQRAESQRIFWKSKWALFYWNWIKYKIS